MRTARLLRRLARATAALVLVLVLGLAALLAFLATDAGERQAARWLAVVLSQPERRIDIARLELGFPGEIRVIRLSAADAGGEWLAIDRIAVNWRPTELLKGRVAVDRLHASTVDWRRRPARGDARSVGAVELPRLPLSLRVARFSVESLRLGAAVSGAAAVLRLDGELGAELRGEVRSRLHIVRTDGSPAAAHFEALLRPNARWFSLKASAEEPAGGLLPNLIGAPEEPFSLAFEGAGPLSAWQGELAARIGGRPFLDLSIAAAQARRFRLELAGRLDLRRHLPALPSGQLELEARLASEDGTHWRLERSRWALASMTASFRGDIDLAASPTLALDFEAHRQGDAPLPLGPPAARLGALTASGRIEGPLHGPAVRLEARLEAAEFAALAGREVSILARFQPLSSLFDGIPSGKLEISGRAAALQIADARLSWLVDGPAKWDAALHIDGRGGVVEAQRLQLALAGATADGTGRHDWAAETGSFAGTVALPELSTAAASAGIALSGEASLDTTLRWSLKEAALAGTVEGRAEKLRLIDERLADLIGSTLSLAGTWQVDPDGGVSIRSGTLEGRHFRLAGELTLAPGSQRLQAHLRAAVPDLAPLSPLLGVEAAGRAELAARLEGPPSAPTGRVEFKVSQAVANDVAFGTIAGSVDAAPGDGGLQGRLDVSAMPSPGPVRLTAGFHRQGGLTRLEDLRLSGGGLSVRGALTVNDGTPILTGDLTVEAGNLAPWLPLTGLQGAGRLSADLKLAARDGRHGLEAVGALNGFRVSLGEGNIVEGERLAFGLAAVWPAEGAESALRAEADDIRIGQAVLSRVSLEASGNPAALRFAVESEGVYLTEFTVGASGTLALRGEAMTVELARLEARLLATTVALRQPARLRLADGGVAVETMHLAVGDGSADLAGQIDPARVDFRLQAAGLSLAPLAALGADIEGRLHGRLELHGEWPAPVGTAELTVEGVRWRGLPDLPPASLRLAADWRQGRVDFRGQIDSGEGRPLQLTAALPLRVSASPWAVQMPPREAVSLLVSWQGDAASIWRLLPYAVHRVEGALAVELRLAGTIGQPVVEGSISLSRGEYEHLELGTLLRDLELRIVTDGADRLRIAHLTASDGDGGRLAGEGEISFRDLRRLTYASRVTLENFFALRRDDLKARVDGTIEISGAADGGSISGRLTTRSAEATLIDSLGGADVVELQVVEIGAGREAAGNAETAGRRLNLTLDLQVTIPNRAFLRGRGLESEWAGEIRINGTTTAPLISGRLEAVRGRFTILGKSFVFGPSAVEIVTVENTTDALLNISATHSGSDLDVTIAVTGSASSPSLDWSSQPALPRDEIVARLLFGRGTGQLTALEAVQLASALAELSGRGPSAGSLLDRARHTLGVDILRFTGDTTTVGGTRVEAGKYLSDRVYVGVRQGAAAGSGGARIELQVLPRVSIESEVQSSGANIGAKFKWDY